jgi:hypothetical protein
MLAGWPPLISIWAWALGFCNSSAVCTLRYLRRFPDLLYHKNCRIVAYLKVRQELGLKPYFMHAHPSLRDLSCLIETSSSSDVHNYVPLWHLSRISTPQERDRILLYNRTTVWSNLLEWRNTVAPSACELCMFGKMTTEWFHTTLLMHEQNHYTLKMAVENEMHTTGHHIFMKRSSH